MRDVFAQVGKSCKILIVGCGNSALGEDLVKDGYVHVHNIDYSSVLVEQMVLQAAQLLENHPNSRLTYEAADVTAMTTIEQNSYDIVIDKGTLDALLCDKCDLWFPPPEVLVNAHLELQEVYRVLKDGGQYLYITFGQPHFRKPILQHAKWSQPIKTTKLSSPGVLEYFCYTCTK